MMRALSQVGRVDWFGYLPQGLAEDAPECGQMPAFAETCSYARAIPEPAWPVTMRHQHFRRFWRHAVSPVPVLYGAYPGHRLAEMARPYAEAADLIWVERLYLAWWLRDYGHKMIVDVDDLESVKALREAELTADAYTRWLRRRDAASLVRVEWRARDWYSRLVVCAEGDRATWRDDASRVWVVSNGVDDSLFSRSATSRVAGRMVFVGSLDYGPNEDAVLWFCRDILPLIAETLPEVSFTVVGKKPSERVRALHDGRRIIVTGGVPEVAPYVQEAAVSVVPLRVGGGTRLKILESMALGTPVVSTTVGAEGLDFTHGQHLLLADSEARFAADVVRLMKDRAYAEAMAEQAHDRAAAQYRWSSIRDSLAGQITKWAGERAAGKVA